MKSNRPRLTLEPFSADTGMMINQPCPDRAVGELVAWLKQRPPHSGRPGVVGYEPSNNPSAGAGSEAPADRTAPDRRLARRSSLAVTCSTSIVYDASESPRGPCFGLRSLLDVAAALVRQPVVNQWLAL